MKNHGTNPKVVETPTSDQNLDMGPSPMIPEGPKTLGVVEISSKSPEIDRSNPEGPKTDFSINPSTELKQGHAPDHQITHEKANLRLKNHPIPTADAPSPAIAISGQSLGKSQIPANPELISENGTYRDDQHEIPHLPVKNHKFLTPLENRRRSTAGAWWSRAGDTSPECGEFCYGPNSIIGFST